MRLSGSAKTALAFVSGLVLALGAATLYHRMTQPQHAPVAVASPAASGAEQLPEADQAPIAQDKVTQGKASPVKPSLVKPSQPRPGLPVGSMKPLRAQQPALSERKSGRATSPVLVAQNSDPQSAAAPVANPLRWLPRL